MDSNYAYSHWEIPLSENWLNPAGPLELIALRSWVSNAFGTVPPQRDLITRTRSLYLKLPASSFRDWSVDRLDRLLAELSSSVRKANCLEARLYEFHLAQDFETRRMSEFSVQIVTYVESGLKKADLFLQSNLKHPWSKSLPSDRHLELLLDRLNPASKASEIMIRHLHSHPFSPYSEDWGGVLIPSSTPPGSGPTGNDEGAYEALETRFGNQWGGPMITNGFETYDRPTSSGGSR